MSISTDQRERARAFPFPGSCRSLPEAVSTTAPRRSFCRAQAPWLNRIETEILVSVRRSGDLDLALPAGPVHCPKRWEQRRASCCLLPATRGVHPTLPVSGRATARARSVLLKGCQKARELIDMSCLISDCTNSSNEFCFTPSRAMLGPVESKILQFANVDFKNLHLNEYLFQARLRPPHHVRMPPWTGEERSKEVGAP